VIDLLTDWVARRNATIHTKLLAAFLLITLLLLSAAAAGVYALNEMHRHAEQTLQLQRKIGAYRQLNHDTIAQLHGVASALLEPEEPRLEATLRQLKQFGYDLDRLQFVAQDEREVMARVRADFEQFIGLVARTVELVREGKQDEGRQLQLRVAAPLADRLERLTNELVNKAEADLVGGIELANQAYARSRLTVMVCAAISVALALALGYTISWSLIAPIRQMEARLSRIAAGEFSDRVDIPNRDELGSLAHNLNRMSEELGRLYAQVDAAREEAERANRAKSSFLAAASHDLRQPMHALNLWVSNLRIAHARGDREAARRAADTIEEACRSMSASFNAILDLSKLEASHVRPEFGVVNVSQLVAQVHAEFDALARQKGLALRLHPSRRAPLFVRSDPILLGRAVRNLLSNAIRYTQRGGVVIGEVAHGDSVEIAVFDSGIGIAPRHQQSIFTEFFQVTNPLRDPGQGVGLGLGLAIVRRSVELLDGHRVDCFSREGRGSRFSIHAPQLQSDPSPGSSEVDAIESERIAGAYVVVVDDEPAVLAGLTKLLENWGCLVQAGHDGVQVMDGLQHNERIPDLLITDLRLGNGETGLDVARTLHRSMGAPVPVLVLTGDLIASVALDDAQVPVRLLHKPVVAGRLRAVMEELLPVRSYV